ncbi:WD40 repeat domain-containing protein [bacterium]|nr:WD40 repeat domain-containing protein [bacterium]
MPTIRWMLLVLLALPVSTWGQSVSEIAGHQGGVASVAYSADGKQLVSGSFDRSLRRWDVASKAELQSIIPHSDMVLAISIRPDGKQILSGGRDRLAKLWNIGPIEPARTIGPLPVASSIVVSPDEKMILALGGDGIVRIFSPETGECLGERTAHQGAIKGIAWSADRATIFTVGDDGQLKAWNSTTGEQAGILPIGAGSAGPIAALSDGSALVNADPSGNRTAWRLPFGSKRALAGSTADVTHLARSGSRLVSFDADASIHVHDIATGNEERVIYPGFATRAFSLATHDPDLLLLAGEDKTLRVFRVSDGSLLSVRAELGDVATAVAFGPMAQSVVWAEPSGIVRRLPYPFTIEYDERVIESHSAAVTSISRGSLTGMMISASADRTVVLRDQLGNPIRSFSLLSPVRQAVLSASEDRLAAVGADNVLRLWLVNGAEQKVIAGAVGGIAFSPDGKWLAFGGAENKAWVLPTDLTAEPRAVATHGGPVLSLAFSPTNAQLATGGADNVIKWVDVTTGTEIRALAGHQGPVRAIAISSDGKSIASGSDDKAVRLWNADSGALTATLAESAAPVTTLAWAADNATLAVGSADNNVRLYQSGILRSMFSATAPASLVFGANPKQIWLARDDNKVHVLTEREPVTVASSTAVVHGLAVTPDGSTLLTAGADTLIRTWEWATGKALRGMAHSSAVTHMTLSPDGSRIASAEASGKIRLASVAGEPLALLEGTLPIQSLTWSIDGSSFLATTGDGQVRQISATGVIVDQSIVAGATTSLILDGAGNRAFAGKDKLLSIEPSARLWQLPGTSAVVSMMGTPAGLVTCFADGTFDVRDSAGAVKISAAIPPIVEASVLADGSAIDVISNDQRIRRVSLADGKVINESSVTPNTMLSLSRTSDGSRLATRLADGSTLLWSAGPSGPPMPGRTVPSPGSAGKVLFANQWLVSSSADNIIRIYSPPAPVLMDLAGHQAAIFGVAYGASGTLAATTSADGSIIIWQTLDGAKRNELKGHKGTVYSASFSSDGTKLLSAGADKEIIVWDLGAGQEVRRLTGASEQLYQVAFLPGDKFVVGAGVDRVVRIWDIETGNVALSMEGHSDEIYGLSVRPDGGRLATSGNAGQVIVWDRATGQKLFETKLPAEAYSVSYRPDGLQLAVGSANGKIYLIDLPDPAR